jgi:proteasome accessory factor C
MASRSQRAGRRGGTERVREVVALVGALCETGDSVNVDAISSRLGVSKDEAQNMMDIICQAAGERSGGLLISCDEDEREYTLQYQGMRGRPVRLTNAETMAVMHGLDAVGVGVDSPLRKKLEAAFASTEVEEETVQKALGARSNHSDVLSLCAKSQVLGRSVSFLYRGIRDSEPRRRNVLVRSISPQEASWHIRAIDLDLNQERTFRLDRITDACLGIRITDVEDIKIQSDTREVELVFLDQSYLLLFDWPKLRVLRRLTGKIHATIPVYSSSESWLIRRITACGGKVLAKDERIMQEVRQYAASLL